MTAVAPLSPVSMGTGINNDRADIFITSAKTHVTRSLERTRSLRSWQKPSEEEGSEIQEAAQIVEILKRRVAFLSGGVDKKGRPILSIPVCPRVTLEDLAAVLKYLGSLLSEDSRDLGFIVIIDGHGEGWKQLKTSFIAVHTSLEDFVSAVYVIKPDGLLDRQKPVDLKKEKLFLDFQPQYITLKNLHKLISPSQLTSDFGGTYSYDHEQWLHKRLALERYLKASTAVLRHLDTSCVLLNTHTRNLTQDNMADALQHLRKFYDNVMTAPNTALKNGQDLLEQLEMDLNSGFKTLSGNEPPEEILIAQNQVRNKIKEIQSQEEKFTLLWRECQHHIRHVADFMEFETGVKEVTEWILGSGDKMLSSQDDIGESLLRSEELLQEHSDLEISCTKTYGQYAELRHKAENMLKREHPLSKEIEAQRNYVDNVCRAFASRLERRRSLLTASTKFHRLLDEDFKKTEDVRKMLLTDKEITDTHQVQLIDTQLHHAFNRLVSEKSKVPKESHRLLDLMLTSLKHTSGKDTSPKAEWIKFHVQYNLEKVEQQKQELLDVIKLKRLRLEQVTQLLRCEEDAEQSIQWLQDLTELMVNTHIQLGRSVQEVESIRLEHQKFEETAKGTYDYGRQLLETALQIRHSCQYNLQPNSQLANRLFTTWRVFLQGSQERATRLSVCWRFHKNFLNVMEKLVQLEDGLQEEFKSFGWIRKNWIVRRYKERWIKVVTMLTNTICMARALLTRMVKPVVKSGVRADKYLGDEAAAEVIRRKMEEGEKKATDVERKFFDENASLIRSELAKSGSLSQDEDSWAHTSSCTEDWWSCASNGTSGEDWKSADESQSDGTRFRAKTRYPSLTFQAPLNSQCGKLSEEEKKWTQTKETQEMSQIQYTKEMSEAYTTTKFSFQHMYETRQPQTLNAAAQTTASKLPERSKFWPSIDKKKGPQTDDTKRGQEVVRQIEKTNKTDVDYTDPLLKKMTESKEWMQLKIQEIYPSMTEVGSTLEEAMELQQQHEQVLEKLQTKQSPVEELLNQADELISNQKPKAEVYAAMADNLGLAWKDLNAQLEQRRQILEQAVNFHSRASEFVERMDVTQKETFDSYLPSDTETCKLLLQQHHDAKKGMLEASMHTLNEGQSLLECLREVGIHSMGDSRPEHMRHAAQQACIRIERYMESLHDKRRSLEAQWLKRKTQLEQCLQLCLLYSDMDQVENWVKTKGKEYLKQNNLGDSAAGAEILLHEHQKALTEAKEAQDRAVRLLKTAEQLANSGHYASEEIKTRGYTLLSDTSDILASLDQRKEHLSVSLSFFNMAQTALNKLDQIEVQLTTIDLPRSSAALVQQHAQLAHAIEDITSPALHEGHVLLQRVGRSDSGATGVARKIAELEDRRHHLSSLCTAHRAENLERSAAFTNFCEKYEILYNWILSAGLAFLQGHQDMGSVLSMAKHFLQEHERLQNEAQMKGIEVQALLSIIPPLLSAGDEEAEAVQQKAKNLRYQWGEMKSLLENRIKLSQHYVSFHKLAVQLANEMDVVEEMIREKEPQNESIMKQLEEKWMACQQIFLQLNNTGKNFIENATQVDDKHLDTKRAILCVETILEDFKTRKEKLSNLWMFWQTQVSAGKEQKIHWEQFLKDAQKTIESAKDMQEKLYPIIPQELNNAETIAEYLEKYQTISVPTAKRVLMEVEMRLKTAETIQVSPSFQNQKDILVNQFTKLHQELNNKIAEFHVLLTMMVTLFHNFVELEKLVEKQEMQYVTAVLPSGLDEMERMMREHDASKPTILELFKFTANEAQQVINKISQVEPLHVAPKDTEKIKMVDGRKKHFETAWEEHKRKLEQQYQFCLFNRDLQQINYQLSELSKHLEDMRGNYGESLPGAKATSQAFVQFEKTIELLEKRIQTFISTAEKMLIDQHAESSHIKIEIHSLQNKWSTFHMNIGENRRLIDLSIEYFSLIEEADEWFKEGSTILVSIARKSTSCKSPNDANNLLDEVRNFLKPGEVKQDERLRKISTLATQLYGLDHTPMSMQQVSGKNKEMLESFSVINDELSSLAESLKEAEQERERQKKEKEEADAAVKAAQAEAAAAKAAAAAAQEAVKAAQAAAKAVPVKPVPLAKVTIDQQEAVPIPTETQNAHIEITKPLQFVADVPKPKAPVFVVPLIDAEVMEGSKYTFICQVDGFPQPEVQWFKDSILIQNNPDYQTTYVDGMCTLTIEETFTEDSARFSCKAVNPAGTAETQGLLTVNESRPHEELIPPHFTQELQDGVVQEGKSFQFECVVVGNPLPLVSWFKNDICIDNSPDYAITNNNGQCTLKIEEAYLEDESRYTCRAANQAGQVACSAKLTVKPLEAVELPKFLTPLSNVMARAGQKLRLECRVQGQPEPVLSWFHNGKPITNREMHYDGNKATLFIIEAFPKDAGTYMAVAKNQAGEATSSCNVLVKGRLPMETSDSELASDMEPVKPKVMQPLKNLTVGEGSTVRMDCIIVGQPEPEVIWYHNEKPVKESNDIQLLFEGDKCSLIIHEAYLEDAGTYKCVAINSGGEASSTGVLTVESLSEVSDIERSHKDIILSIEKATAPKFSKLLMDTSVIEGQRVKLECQVTGEPQPFVSWYKDGKQIDASTDYQITHDNSGLISLTIPEVFPEDGGSYTVKATNKAGEAKCFCTLSVSPKKAEPKVQYKPSVLQFPPKFTQHLIDTHVGKGKEAKFECNVTGTPKPKIQWCYKGWPITADKDHKITVDGDKHCLVIPTISSFHSGRYSITAENPIGKATSSALLVVEELFDDKVLWDGFGEPKIQSMVMMKKTTMMQTSTLSKSGGPQENGGYSISQSSAVEEHGYRRVGEALPEEYHSSEKSVVHEVDRITPTKTVVTTAVLNMDTPAVTTGPAAVWGKTSTSTPKYIAPRFLKPVSSTLVEVGEKVYLEGQIEGNPEPTVKWFKNNLELHSRPEVLISLTKGKASLLIPKATESDSGRYSCSATNEAGQATSTAEVVVKPHRVPPKFIKRLQACVVKAGEKIELDIEVAGDPLPEVTWYRNNELVKNSPDFRLKSEGSKHSLVIPEAFPDDACILTVKATNCVGEAQSTANLIVEEDLCEVDQKVTYKEFSVVEQKKEVRLPATYHWTYFK